MPFALGDSLRSLVQTLGSCTASGLGNTKIFLMLQGFLKKSLSLNFVLLNLSFLYQGKNKYSSLSGKT